MNSLYNILINQPLDQFELFVLNGLTHNYFFNIFLNDTIFICLLENTHFFSNLFLYLFYIFIIVTVLSNVIIFNKIEIFEYSLMKYLLESFFYIF